MILSEIEVAMDTLRNSRWNKITGLFNQVAYWLSEVLLVRAHLHEVHKYVFLLIVFSQREIQAWPVLHCYFSRCDGVLINGDRVPLSSRPNDVVRQMRYSGCKGKLFN